jgi:hypothetical protein
MKKIKKKQNLGSILKEVDNFNLSSCILEEQKEKNITAKELLLDIYNNHIKK